MDNLLPEIFNFSPLQLTTSSKITEHAVLLSKVRLKRIIIKSSNYYLVLLRRDSIQFLFPPSSYYSLAHVYGVIWLRQVKEIPLIVKCHLEHVILTLCTHGFDV